MNTRPTTAKTLVTAYARIGGHSVGIVANQRHQVRTKKAGIQMGGVIYSDSADKAARFVMDCNQTGLPIIFFQDVTGFMVGRDAEQSGIIRSGAKLVNAVSNSIVPKITVVVGGSFGAGNYALCGKAYDPRFILAWPNARYAVMGAAQASDTVFSVLARSRERGDKKASPEELEQLRAKVKETYEEQTDIRYGAARGWIDAIIQPHETRDVLLRLLGYVARPDAEGALSTWAWCKPKSDMRKHVRSGADSFFARQDPGASPNCWPICSFSRATSLRSSATGDGTQRCARA